MPMLLVSFSPLTSLLHYGDGSQLFMARKGTYFCNTEDAEINLQAIKGLTLDEYLNDFISQIIIQAPIGRHHSMANIWGAEVFARVADLKYNLPGDVDNERKRLYYKYIFAKTEDLKFILANHSDVTPPPNDPAPSTINATDKKILVIDDEADKGWGQLLKALFSKCSVDVASEKISGFDQLSKQFVNNIENDYYDLYILDLRLRGDEEESVVDTQRFSGMDVLRTIKKYNEGNQVIMMTASNKAWNMKRLIDDGANGYYIKEAPELMLSAEFSKENFNSFIADVNKAFNNSYKRDLWRKCDDLITYIERKDWEDEYREDLMSQLNIFSSFMLKAQTPNDIAATYVVLFEVLEILKQYYCKTLAVPESIKEIIEDECNTVMPNKLYDNLKTVNRARNNYIHKLKNKCDVKANTSKGLKVLFSVVDQIIREFN